MCLLENLGTAGRLLMEIRRPAGCFAVSDSTVYKAIQVLCVQYMAEFSSCLFRMYMIILILQMREEPQRGEITAQVHATDKRS